MENERRKSLGKWGEEFAANYLKQQGFHVIHCNYYTRYGELDIVAREKDCLVFIEVKTRSNLRYGSPLEAVTLSKQQHLRMAAELYLQKNPTAMALRFDVIAILKTKGQEPQLEHVRNAF